MTGVVTVHVLGVGHRMAMLVLYGIIYVNMMNTSLPHRKALRWFTSDHKQRVHVTKMYLLLFPLYFAIYNP
jgi:hypothetical protein